ncbi:hypothetical protein [Nonlabens xiamenensis]|uniref:hypothetical protein n=1 Tax=Nonlabens xiamenensis TaxID=2341043 RepID=UPI0013DE288C|nr:hypothetical protein [Nonlabens xiamenensis]
MYQNYWLTAVDDRANECSAYLNEPNAGLIEYAFAKATKTRLKSLESCLIAGTK